MKAWRRLAGCATPAAGSSSSSTARPSTAPTPGNIGPVADALVAALGCGFALACPAFPANARSVYQGHLFVGSVLLNESGMEHHPLTPMTDANLVRVLSRQTDGTVGLVPYRDGRAGRDGDPPGDDRVEGAGAPLRHRRCGERFASAVRSARRREHHALITGGSGVAMGLPENFRRAGKLPEQSDAAALPMLDGHAAVLAGSCSRATLAQLGFAREQCRCCNSIRWRRRMRRA